RWPRDWSSDVCSSDLGESFPRGVASIGHDGAWGERIPDFRNPAWQAKRIGEAVDAARMGFGGVMLDNVSNAGRSREGAEFVKRKIGRASGRGRGGAGE